MNANAPSYLNGRVVKETRDWARSQATAGNFTSIAQRRKQHESEGEEDVVNAIDETLTAFKKQMEADQAWPNQLRGAIIALTACGIVLYALIKILAALEQSVSG